MSNNASDGIHLTKDYYKDFMPTDLQWSVTKVDDDFTLYDLFRLVYHAHMILPDIFTTMGMSGFMEFWKQIQLDRDPEDDNDVAFLELYWHVEYDTRMTKKTGKPTDQPASRCGIIRDNHHNYWDDPHIADISNLMGFHGVGEGCPCKDLDLHECGDDCPTETGYAIEFTPVNNLAHLPVRVSPKIEFYPPYVESDRDFHRTGFELTIEPTLWCLITSVFWELTFMGSDPDTIRDEGEEILGRAKEIKEHLERERQENEDDGDTDVG